MRPLLATALAALCASTAGAHYNMLLPDKHSAKKGEVVTFTYQWGHPFEHQLFDAPKPTSLVVLAPNGKKIDLTDKLVKAALPGEKGKKVAGYRLRFTPELRGDYIFLLRTPPILLEEDGASVEDTVKVVLHVQAQKGWGDDHRYRVDVRPLTRPYGLEPGMVFQARTTLLDKALSPFDALVEVERYNPTPPKVLPPEEHITRTTTAVNGVVTTTLTDPGWWSITATHSTGRRRLVGEKAYHIKERCTFWAFVAEKPRTR